ncbi:MAG: MFS transporter [Burkholderiales bacterium]
MLPMSRKVKAWALYYWGNHAFTTSIITVFFPIFFKDYWNQGVDVSTSTFRLGLANSCASLIVALSAPVLGAIADKGGHKKRFLLGSAFLGAVMVFALHYVGLGQWQWAMFFYMAASIGYWWGNVFGDSMLPSVSPPGKLDMTSAVGYFSGYLGGGLFLVLGLAMSLNPQLFGLADKVSAVKLILILTAVWWVLFSLPLWFWVPEPSAPAQREPLRETVRDAFGQLAQTFRHVRGYKPVYMFLIAYWVYIDGVNTIIQMAVDYGRAIGFTTNDLIGAIVLVQFIGIPAALAFGRIGERIGAKRGIFIGLAVYTLVSILAAFMHSAWQFYVLAAMIGLVQGGVQLLSRSYYARLVPPERAGEFFGFYNMLGEFAAIIGPVLIGTVSILTHSPRISILSVIVLFAVGAVLLGRVQQDKPGVA